MSVIKKSKSFCLVYKGCLDDPRISLLSKGIYSYCCAIQDSEITLQDLYSASPDSRETIDFGLKELIDNGYLEFKDEEII